jgi:uncharacterized membrane protein
MGTLSKVEILIFSVGFSVAILMLGGLVINEVIPLFGVATPLTQTSLLVALNLFLILGEALMLVKDEKMPLWTTERVKVNVPLLLAIALPILSILGATILNVFGSNLVLLVMIAAVPLLLAVLLLTATKKSLPPEYYAIAVLMISVAMVFHTSLITKYLINFGSDISLEYATAEYTIRSAIWIPSAIESVGRFDSMLSITVLPAVYVNLLNMSLTSVFKIVYPLIFSLVPLGLYQLWQKSIGYKYAFVAAFLLIAQETFFTEMIGLARQMIAEVFFVLLVYLIIEDKLKPRIKIICFGVFASALVMSHYALAIIFGFFLGCTFIFFFYKKHVSRNITASLAILFLVIMFVWYIYPSASATFNDLVSYGDFVYQQLGGFLNPASRGATVLRGLGLDAPASIWNVASRVFAYFTEFLIGVGFIALILKKTNFVFEKEYVVLSTIAMVFLGVVIVVPGMARTFNMSRFYHLLLFFLAPLMILGVTFLVKRLSRQRRELITAIFLLVVLVPYFLFQTSFIYEVTGSPSWSLPLSGYRMSAYQLYFTLGYVDDAGFSSADWVSQNLSPQNITLFADKASLTLLISYGSFPIGEIYMLENTTTSTTLANRTMIIYLCQMNVESKVVITEYYSYSLENLTVLTEMNKIFSNAGNEIYENPQ